ncbi:MAG: mannonate dehydratase, partial [Bacteroidota bacterium]
MSFLKMIYVTFFRTGYVLDIATMSPTSLFPTWRWYGPQDPITLAEVSATGASGVVTALHHIPNGAVWPRADIRERLQQLQAYDLPWSVVESVPVHEGIKTATKERQSLLNNYLQTLENLALEGVTTICYNFMPILDWTRTWLRQPVAGGTTLALRAVELVAFDCFLLARLGAKGDYAPDIVAAAEEYFEQLDAGAKEELQATLLLGLPGSEETYSLDDFRTVLPTYHHIPASRYRDHLIQFLELVAPEATRLGIKLTIHPDDPPYSVFGLPRIVSDAQDIAAFLSAVDEPSNGLCLCTGSLGVSPDNDLPALIRKWGDR